MAELSLPWTAKNTKRYWKKQIRIAYEKDLAESIWTDRPDFPAGKVTVLDEKIAGKSVEEN